MITGAKPMQKAVDIDHAADKIKDNFGYNEVADKIEINREAGLISVTTTSGFTAEQLGNLEGSNIEFRRCYARIKNEMTIQFRFRGR